MKIEIEKDFPQYFKPAYPEEFELFSHFEVTAGIPTVLFAITTWKENGKPNVCFHSWSCFHGDKTAFFAVMGNLYQHTHTYANIQREKCFCIREMRKEEYSLLSDFLYEAIYIPDGTAAPPKSVITCPELQVYIADFGNSKHDKALIVEVDGNIVGAIWARIMNDYGHIDENTPSLAMSVLKAYRGMGIGTLLLTQMLLAEKAAGYAKISLSVQKDNYAVKLYRKAGFTTVKETTEEYIMVADLNSICKMEEENGF